MSKKYSHIKQYEKEIVPAMMKKFNYKSIMEVPKLDKIVINIGLGDTKENPKTLENAIRNQRKLSAGISNRPKGRPRKNGTKLPPSIQQLNKLTQLQYELASKERHIKRLEMENELMRDFLSLTEGK